MGRVSKTNANQRVRVALCGNPNVGKSTLYNSLTGKNRHTGNWSGKTVDVDSAKLSFLGTEYEIYDIPGTYSLISHSKEEELAVKFLTVNSPDVCVYVCDVGALTRSLPLLLQIREAVGELIVCLNLEKTAVKSGIRLDAHKLSSLISCTVISIDAKSRKSVKNLLSALDNFKKTTAKTNNIIRYPAEIEYSILKIKAALGHDTYGGVSSYFLAQRLLDGSISLSDEVFGRLTDIERKNMANALDGEIKRLFNIGFTGEKISDAIVFSLVESARSISSSCFFEKEEGARYGKGALDKILCGKYTAYPIMALFLAFCFFLTLRVASYPSEFLEYVFSRFNLWLSSLLLSLSANETLVLLLCDGILGTVFTVVAVMLPPMAIFFPMFALLEQAGYLPRIAYNLDKPFAMSGACGKQALTMCMGIGCNAVGVSESRIIDSERERNLAILTNSFVPCNGRFPILASTGSALVIATLGSDNSLLVALFVTALVLLGFFMTFPVNYILSKTIFRGNVSSFTIELPPLRKPQIISVVLHSLKTKVLSVLLRAVTVAAPMGLLIFALSYFEIGGTSLLIYVSDFLDPVAQILGLDGVILLAFILALPASEMVIPLILSANSVLAGTLAGGELLLLCGFTPLKAICTSVFCLFHFPCSTTLLTVYRETKSVKITLLSAAIPTLIGVIFTFIINLVGKIIF
jgi:ferrous iron transport protein B